MNYQNFHFFNSASSSSSDEFDSHVQDQFESINETENLLGSLATNNTNLAASYAEQHEVEVKHGGTIPGHIVIPRDRELADRNLFNDYFADNPRYNEAMFRRVFECPRPCIVEAVKNHDRYFIQRVDGLGRLGLSTNQKITAAIRMLAYGTPADAADEYIKIGESTTIQCLPRFCGDIVEVFAERYLRSPTSIDIDRLLHIGEKRGFPGMLGSLDWSNNDINFLEASNLFSNLAQASPARAWQKKHLQDIMTACIIMHNMIIEDEHDLDTPIEDALEAPTPNVEMVTDQNIRFQEFLARYKNIRDREAHFALRDALIDHLWDLYSNSVN
ncbi:uncharacterized protein [Primulina eburnea]|uniref:uncharacterized protein n=1 Tax=Primulina eburnea TaxID=1245227 RepID=UPI003C6C9B95